MKQEADWRRRQVTSPKRKQEEENWNQRWIDGAVQNAQGRNSRRLKAEKKNCRMRSFLICIIYIHHIRILVYMPVI
jgi:hypothetical protein